MRIFCNILKIKINRIAKDQSLRQHGSWRPKSKTLSATSCWIIWNLEWRLDGAGICINYLELIDTPRSPHQPHWQVDSWYLLISPPVMGGYIKTGKERWHQIGENKYYDEGKEINFNKKIYYSSLDDVIQCTSISPPIALWIEHNKQ